MVRLQGKRLNETKRHKETLGKSGKLEPYQYILIRIFGVFESSSNDIPFENLSTDYSSYTNKFMKVYSNKRLIKQLSFPFSSKQF